MPECVEERRAVERPLTSYHKDRIAPVASSNPKTITQRLREGLRCGALLIGLGIIAGLIINAVRPQPLPWAGSWSPSDLAESRLHNLPSVSLEQARSLYQAGKAVFLDTRDPLSFEEGHIPGALSVPLEDVENYIQQLQTLAAKEFIVIAYCDGFDCPASTEVAEVIQEYGVTSVHVFVEGWEAWRAAGYPVEEGGP